MVKSPVPLLMSETVTNWLLPYPVLLNRSALLAAVVAAETPVISVAWLIETAIALTCALTAKLNSSVP